MNRTANRSVRSALIGLTAGLLCYVVVLADNEGSDVVPDDQCACRNPTLHLVRPGTEVESQCRVIRGGRVQITQDNPPRIHQRAEQECNNCLGCDPLHCVHNLCVTITDQGTVSGTAGLSTALKAEINNALAGAIGIETTAEFRVGRTSSTTISVERCVECGCAPCRPCSRTDYEVVAYVRHPLGARLPLKHAWYVRLRYPNGDTTPWELEYECPGTVGWASISGKDGTGGGGCRAQTMACEADCPCDDPV